ncbi:MAG: alpha/beta hydrolase [Alphaproteobacteria bacterium]|nr:alpha/beta hydrolase [Alphaproteobacteria bacterium]
MMPLRAFYIFILSFVLLAVICDGAAAQSLRERLEARRSERTQGEDGGSGGKLREMLSARTAGNESAAALPEGTRVLRDVAYGAHEKQKIDVYLPPDAKAAPVIFMVHGGAWITGDKSNKGVVGSKGTYWLPKGYAMISANYRMVGDGADPYTQALDVAAALAYVQQHAAEWGLDATRIVTMGHSAGAHLVGLLAVNPDIAAGQGAKPWRATVMLDSGAVDVVTLMKMPHARFYDKAFGNDETLWGKTSLTRQVSVGAVPLMIVCSSTRKDKPCAQGEALARKLQQMKKMVSVYPVELGHGAVTAELGKDNDYTRDVDAFIQSVIQ